MPSPEPDQPGDVTEELERAIAQAQHLSTSERRARLCELRTRYPEHVELIEALSDVLGFAKAVESDVRVSAIGTYRIVREIGQGGMGRVYLARRASDEREVALKVIRPELDSEQILARFEREAAVLQRLEHEGIARFFEAGQTEVEHADGHTSVSPFLAMEFVDGEELLTFARVHDLDPKQRVQLCVRICDALGYAHGKGVIHRDIKPGNVLVAIDDAGVASPKLLDFGIARANVDGTIAQTLTLTGQGIIGTAPYMSPEQVSGGSRDLDARSDVYSMGVVLFELLAGRLPYELDSQALPEIARIIAEDEPTRLGSLDTRFRGSALETILAKTLEKRPERRYGNAAQLGADLASYLEAKPIQARPVSAWRRGARFARRHRVLVATMLALAVGLVLTTWFAVREQRASDAAKQLAYGASVAAAAAAIAQHDTLTLTRVLQAAPVELRGWEWRHLASRIDNALARASLPERERGRPFVGFDGQGRLLISRCGVNASGRIFELTGQRGPIRTRQIAELPRAKGILLLPNRSDIVRYGPRLTAHRVGVPAPVWESAIRGALDCCIAGDRIIAIGRRGNGYVLTLDGDVERTWTLDGWDRVVGIVGSAEHGWLACWPHGPLRFWRLRDGAHPTELPSLRQQRVRVAAASADGRWLAVGGEDGTLGLWRVPKDGVPKLAVPMPGHTDAVIALAFSPDGSRLASGGEDNTVRIWQIGRAFAEAVHTGHDDPVRAIAFDATSNRLASVDSGGGVRVWSAHPDPRVLQHPDPVEAFVLHDGIVFTACADGNVRLFDIASSELIATWRGSWKGGRLVAAALSPDGTRLAVAAVGEGITVVDTATGASVGTLEGSRGGGAWGVDYSPDGTAIAARSRTGVLRVWSARTQEVLARGDSEAVPRSPIGFRDDGRALFIGLQSGDVQVVRVEDLSVERVLSGHSKRVIGVGRDQAGARICTLAVDRLAIVREMPSGRVRFRLSGHTASPLCVAFSPNGERIATGGHGRVVRIWDARRGTQLVSLAGHRDSVTRVEFTRDGRRLITSSGDWSVRIWDDVPLAERMDARTAYREFAARVEASIREAAATDDPERSLAELADRRGWTERQRQIARQLLIRARSR